MALEMFCVIVIALALGTAIAFNGYRWFIILLPIVGFVFGFGLGAQTMQAIFGQELFATVASWVVGLFVAAIFAVLSYFFYFIGVAIFAASIGYTAGVALMTGLFGYNLDFLTWIVGIAVAVGLVFVFFKFNIQKYFIIVATALMGTTTIITSLFFPLGLITIPQMSKLAIFPVMRANPFWLIIFIVLAGAGIYTQIVTTKTFVLDVEEKKF
jgi:hypothetical protein